jgi:hypothetical protein
MRLAGRIGFSILTVLLAVNTASANEYYDRGAYLILGGLTGFQQFDAPDEADIGTSLGFELRGGYRFLPYFSAEGQMDFFTGFKLRTGDPEAGDFQIDGFNFTANAKAYYPLGRFHPYALVGLGGMYAQLRTDQPVGTVCRPGYWGWWCSGVYGQVDEEFGFVTKFGGGLDIYLGDMWAISLDATYVKPYGNIDMLKYISFNWGVKFEFD